MDIDVIIEFNLTAFKHKYTEADIYNAFDTFTYDGPVIDDPEAENKFLVVGFDVSANPIEVMYNVIDENSINVFHAKKCGKKYLHLLNPQGR
jgi:hypothetical protein